jgi:hypothetical protein
MSVGDGADDDIPTEKEWQDYFSFFKSAGALFIMDSFRRKNDAYLDLSEVPEVTAPRIGGMNNMLTRANKPHRLGWATASKNKTKIRLKRVAPRT